MRISKPFSAAAVALTLALGGIHSIPVAQAAGVQFTSPHEALNQGISAFNGGYYELAIPALQNAAENNLFLGQFYLARLYADNRSPHTDHAKAYMLFQKIASDYPDADPDDPTRAPYVAYALTALAAYLRDGVSEISVKPNPKLAGEYLHHAALFFNDEDAQFELAKLQLKGEGVPSDTARGKHWLAILSQKGHAGAQAFLADLYARGMYVPKDPIRALALISVALKNAPAEDRVWIEDTYQSIYCGASTGVRQQVTGMVAEWDQRYGRKPHRNKEIAALDGLDVGPIRTCQNGEAVPLNVPEQKKSEVADGSPPAFATRKVEPFVQRAPPAFMQGGATGSIRPVGEQR